MKRNENANCGNCPYYKSESEECHIVSPRIGDDSFWWPKCNTSDWCGQHPDFWEQAEITNTCPSCWPASDDERAPEWTHVGAQSTFGWLDGQWREWQAMQREMGWPKNWERKK